MDPNEPPNDSPVSRQRLRDLLTVEYRCMALRRLGVTVEWRILDWVNAASCTDRVEVTEAMCNRCPVVAECLAAAVATDDTADWRGGLYRTDRERLWSSFDRTYREVRDLEFMRLDATRLADRDHRLARLQQHRPGSMTNRAQS